MSKTRPHIDGALVVNKPVGPTSHDVVVCARRVLGMTRVGHTGTLDPQASGVLPLVLGQATRLAQHLTGSDKEYLATLRFGLVTDTYDAAGRVLEETGAAPAVDDLAAALARFRGTFEQTPPLYSAKMMGGERSHVRARAGKPLQPSAVTVTVHALELLEIVDRTARIRVRSSAGFYVRSLAHDIGRALGVGAILDGLVRTEAAGYDIAEALPFEALLTSPRAEVSARVRPIETLLEDVPMAALTDRGVRWARHGRDLGPAELLTPFPTLPPLVRLMGPDGQMVGLGEPSKALGLLHPVLVFS
ncbi:MAG: tRNA pseudouridine(55) synthase TruB [Rhodospirillales bacterium]|nr:tRNA pseudouridine(55) synthase TruB [Rhodospirillales bacterium]